MKLASCAEPALMLSQGEGARNFVEGRRGDGTEMATRRPRCLELDQLCRSFVEAESSGMRK